MKTRENNETSIQQAARQIAMYRLADGARDGWARVRLAGEPAFAKGVILMGGYGVTIGLSHFLFNLNVISPNVQQLYKFTALLWLLIGGLHILGKLTPKRVALILAAAAVSQVWHWFFYIDGVAPNVTLYPLYFLFQFSPLLWLLKSEPATAARFGLRADSLIFDFLAAAGLTLALLVYIVVMFNAFGYEMKHDAHAIVFFTAAMTTQNILSFGFMFAVWSVLRDRGMSRGLNSCVALLLILLLSAPPFIAQILRDTANTPTYLVGLVSNAFLFLLLVVSTFERMKNTLPAVVLLTVIVITIRLVGII